MVVNFDPSDLLKSNMLSDTTSTAVGGGGDGEDAENQGIV